MMDSQSPRTCNFGYVEDLRETDRIVNNLKNPTVFGVSSGAGKISLLYKACEQVLGHYPYEVQAIGDCVSFGWAGACNVLRCIQIVKGSGESYIANTCSEAIYGFSRVEVGKRKLGHNDGSVGAWACEAVLKYGTLPRTQPYSGDRARDWGWNGVPDDLEPLAARHLVKTASLITGGYPEVRDVLISGCPVTICSHVGFDNPERDKDGFLTPKGHWSHCMLAIGVDDTHRPGVCIVNSSPIDWVGGPKRHGQPDGSFWVDAEVIDKMVKNDCFAVSSIDGFPGEECLMR